MREQFKLAIADNPDDASLRLVYADWLEEQGEEQAADDVRGEVRKAHLLEVLAGISDEHDCEVARSQGQLSREEFRAAKRCLPYEWDQTTYHWQPRPWEGFPMEKLSAVRREMQLEKDREAELCRKMAEQRDSEARRLEALRLKKEAYQRYHDSLPPCPYNTLEAAMSNGYVLTKAQDYRNNPCTLDGYILTRFPVDQCHSRTAWAKRGYEVREDQKPHAVLSWSYGNYPVYRPDQVEPKRRKS